MTSGLQRNILRHWGLYGNVPEENNDKSDTSQGSKIKLSRYRHEGAKGERICR
jgi:hypothetical protein